MSQTSRFRDLHARTHEIELLISGALVFGLLQVPRRIEAAFDWWQVRLDGLATFTATYLFLYSEMLVYSLLGTFILHLCLRGYWVALLGLESVWPEGWDWSKLKFGPHSLAHTQRQVGTLSSSIDRADDRASVVFAAGALLVLVFVYSLILVLVSVPVSVAVTTMGEGRLSGVVVFFVVMGLLIVGIVGLPLVDRLFGTRIAADSRFGRGFTRALRWVLAVSPVRWTGPVQFVFQSRVGERTLTLALAGASTTLIVVLIGGLLWRSGVVRVDGWRYFTVESTNTWSNPEWYRNSGADRDGLLPSIDADVITGPYLRLYLPYRPRRHNPLLDTRCTPAPDAAASNATNAACVGALYTVSLNAQLLEELSYTFTRDLPSEFVGVIAYLDVRALETGRHELSIEAPGPDAPETITFRIPFYRE